MTTVQRLIDLANAYAEAAVRCDCERRTAREAAGLTEQAAALTAVRHAEDAVERTRTALRADLRHALELPVHAFPDAELPVCTWRQSLVEVRALTGIGARVVRVRYTPAQALAAGAALIACAAIPDQRQGGTLSPVLGAFPPGADTLAGATPGFRSRA